MYCTLTPIDSQTRPGIPGMSSGLQAPHRSTPVRLIQLKAKPVLVPGKVRIEVLEDQVNRGRLEDLPTVVLAVVEDHLWCKASVVPAPDKT